MGALHGSNITPARADVTSGTSRLYCAFDNSDSMEDRVTPVRLDLKKDEKLTIEWKDGTVSVYPIGQLRAMCPCAMCKGDREQKQQRPRSLTILPGNYAAPLSAMSAELVGNYALRLEWSDQHASGIYSFVYLRSIDPRAA